MEEWRYIEGRTDVMVSNLGNIKVQKKSGKWVPGRIFKDNYIYAKDVGRYCSLHRLIAKAFIPNPENKPIINHKDGNKYNNNVNNLEWCTYHENAVHAFKNGLTIENRNKAAERMRLLGKDNSYKYKKIISYYNGESKVWNSIKEASASLGVFESHITEICRGKRKQSKGYTFKYLGGDVDE